MIYGIDIGGTKIEIAVFDIGLQELDSWRTTTPASDYNAFITTLAELIEEADSRFDIKGAVGLGLPGLVDVNGNSLCANIPAATGHNIVADLSGKIDREVVSENDCRCFALSEAVGGAGEGHSTVYGAIIGTGAAGGFTIDGKLLSSRQGIAGEYGHLQLPAILQHKYRLPIRKCGCGLPSCFESYISGPGLLFLHAHHGGLHRDVPTIVEAWRKGETTASETMSCYMDILGASFAAIVMSYDPSVIVLGGGISLIDEVIEELPAAIQNHLFSQFGAPPILKAKFGDSSGVRGAAILARQYRGA